MGSPRGAVRVTADGKDWTLVADINALCAFEEATGKKALKFIEELEASPDGVSLTDLRHLAHSMLLDQHPDATLKDAGIVMTEAGDKVLDAIGEAFPDESGQPNNGDPGAGEAQAAKD